MAESNNDFPGEGKIQKAVALAGEPEREVRPRIVASGRGGVAEQILQVAFANDVRVREDADLVEVLSAVDVESEIPLEAMAAVAEILAYVYRANGSASPVPVPPSPPEEVAR
ncbi:MAG: EscU/YscU/HrcU family type III secretion system export apparatus switch protein [Rhodospirillales bacterium]|nr:EscU/YscU/HrcU family type III secretion system export apparatus switch protein [Rhodospirillales bacterium]